MSDSAGRARGFGARGRGFQSSGHAGLGGNGNGNGGHGDGNGNGNGGNGGAAGDGAAVRGRGGYHQAARAPLRTLPPNVKATSGQGGTTIRVLSNYFKLQTPQNAVVYQYHVDFEPDIEVLKVRKGIMYDQKNLFSGPFIFDGGSNIKTLARLPSNETELTVTKKDGGQVNIKLKYTGEVGWGHPEMIRLYNTQVRRNLANMEFAQIGRYMFDKNVRHNLPEFNLQIWQGIVTAVNEHDGGIMMVCDTIHKFVRSDTVLDQMKNIHRQSGGQFEVNCRRELTNCIVMTTYSNRTYRIDDIAFDKRPSTVFERRTGPTTFADYYREHYNITITDTNQPLIVCNPGKREERAGQTGPILLVPELCIMTGLTESLQNDINVKRKSMELTRMDPAMRVTKLNNFMQKMQSIPENQREMQQWGFKFEPTIVELAARILPAEEIMMQDKFGYQQDKGDFGREMQRKPMYKSVDIGVWGIICTSRDSATADELALTLNRVSQGLGMKLDRPKILKLNGDRVGDFVDACKKVPSHVQIVVVLVPNNNKDRYSAIKKIFCCENPIPSQVVVFRTLSKKQQLMSICTKIAIQMACKLGAEPWALNIPPKNIMVVGYDTYKDPTRKNYAAGGFVCSMNATLTRWYSRVCFHAGHDEMSNNFAANFINGLKRYHELNKRLPEKIIVFRDGVSDQQIDHVFKTELVQVKSAIKTIAPDQEESIKLAFIIVTKRVNARFFAKHQQGLRNPIPGSVIDTHVTRKERYDFYLVSQSVRQGTVSPTMYNIIEDETNWKPIHHQQLSYKLTHLYYNWQGTVSVPAPCQYAHKLAFLTGTSLHKEPSTALADTLFFL